MNAAADMVNRIEWIRRQLQDLQAMLKERAGAAATADFPPTDQAREVHRLLRERLQRHRGELDAILSTELPAFSRKLQELGAGPVIADVR